MSDFYNNSTVQRYLPRVEQVIEKGFVTSQAEKKDSLDSLNRMYDVIRNNVTNQIYSLVRSYEGDSDQREKLLRKTDDAPFGLYQVREKHYYVFDEHNSLEELKKLIDYRTKVSNLPVVKPETKKSKKDAIATAASTKQVDRGTKEYSFKIIADATAPLKEAAIVETIKKANEIIDDIHKKLKENDFDPFKIIPRVERSDFKNSYAYADASNDADEKRARYLRCVIVTDQGAFNPETRRIENKKYKWNEEARTSFVNASVTATENYYDSFVHKMVDKAPNAVEANYTAGNRVWSQSTLEIITTDGEKQIWDTNIMINRSKYNLLFNQWRTTLRSYT